MLSEPGKNPSLVRFLQAWASNPIPAHILSAGADIMEMDEYEPERRVHQIVQKCVILWIEEAGRSALEDQR
ncbi:hypothetical protein [Mesorhizobium sp. Root157]|uniref:hypothetical protein n=1 Tax=Mesorhizobium sp. Root157 TaxID=1736477 RepID=UPI000AD69948|nr:hypothetical protein [Mesorhizobium sp. Root157]